MVKKTCEMGLLPELVALPSVLVPSCGHLGTEETPKESLPSLSWGSDPYPWIFFWGESDKLALFLNHHWTQETAPSHLPGCSQAYCRTRNPFLSCCQTGHWQPQLFCSSSKERCPCLCAIPSLPLLKYLCNKGSESSILLRSSLPTQSPGRTNTTASNSIQSGLHWARLD